MRKLLFFLQIIAIGAVEIAQRAHRFAHYIKSIGGNGELKIPRRKTCCLTNGKRKDNLAEASLGKATIWIE